MLKRRFTLTNVLTFNRGSAVALWPRWMNHSLFLKPLQTESRRLKKCDRHLTLWKCVVVIFIFVGCTTSYHKQYCQRGDAKQFCSSLSSQLHWDSMMKDSLRPWTMWFSVHHVIPLTCGVLIITRKANRWFFFIEFLSRALKSELCMCSSTTCDRGCDSFRSVFNLPVAHMVQIGYPQYSITYHIVYIT